MSQPGTHIDPWVRAQIRLADRQGLLTGRELSLTQVTAINYTLHTEDRDELDERQQEFKYALMANGVLSAQVLFPEIFEVEGEVVEDDAAEIKSPQQGETIIYKFSEQPELSVEEMEAELDALMAGFDDGMDVNGGQLYG